MSGPGVVEVKTTMTDAAVHVTAAFPAASAPAPRTAALAVVAAAAAALPASTPAAVPTALEQYRRIFRDLLSGEEALSVLIMQYARSPASTVFVLGGHATVESLDASNHWRTVDAMGGFDPNLPLTACRVGNHSIFVMVPVPANWSSYEARCGVFDTRLIANTAGRTRYAPKLFSCPTQPGAAAIYLPPSKTDVATASAAGVSEASSGYVWLTGGGSAFALNTPSKAWACLDLLTQTEVSSGLMPVARLGHRMVLSPFGASQLPDRYALEPAPLPAASANDQKQPPAAAAAVAAAGGAAGGGVAPALASAFRSSSETARDEAAIPTGGVRFLLVGGTSDSEFGLSEADSFDPVHRRFERSRVTAQSAPADSKAHCGALPDLVVSQKRCSPLQLAYLDGRLRINLQRDVMDARPPDAYTYSYESTRDDSKWCGVTGGAAVVATVRVRESPFKASQSTIDTAKAYSQRRRAEYDGTATGAATAPTAASSVSDTKANPYGYGADESECVSALEAEDMALADAVSTVVVIGGDSCARSQYHSTRDPATATVLAFHPTANVWCPLAPMHERRTHFGCTVLLDGSIVVCGGRGVDGPIASVERYEPESGVWHKMPPLLVPRMKCTALLIDTL